MLALLSGGRLGKPAQESVRDGARLQQIIDRGEIPAAALVLVGRCL